MTKTPAPADLVASAPQWLATYLADSGKHVWNKQSIKSALIAETHGKCAYCESKILHISFGDIEHIRPRKTNPLLVVTWSNLTLACQKCNNAKGDYDEPSCALIDPYSDDPDIHLHFFGSLVRAAPGDARALQTIETVQLNRAELVAERERALFDAESYIIVWRHSDAAMKRAYEAKLRELVQPGTAYSTAIRHLLETWKISV